MQLQQALDLFHHRVPLEDGVSMMAHPFLVAFGTMELTLLFHDVETPGKQVETILLHPRAFYPSSFTDVMTPTESPARYTVWGADLYLTKEIPVDTAYSFGVEPARSAGKD